MSILTIKFEDDIDEVEEDRIALLLGHLLKAKGNIFNLKTGNDTIFPIEKPHECTEFQWLQRFTDEFRPPTLEIECDQPYFIEKPLFFARRSEWSNGHMINVRRTTWFYDDNDTIIRIDSSNDGGTNIITYKNASEALEIQQKMLKEFKWEIICDSLEDAAKEDESNDFLDMGSIE